MPTLARSGDPLGVITNGAIGKVELREAMVDIARAQRTRDGSQQGAFLNYDGRRFQGW